jgi:hypothetical protein
VIARCARAACPLEPKDQRLRLLEQNMELSVLIAKITSVVYLAAGLGAIFSADYYRKLTDDMFKNAALIYLTGFTAVVLGFLIVHYHNFWRGDWTVLITIIGWLALVKGVLLIAFPQSVQRFSEALFKGSGFKVFPYIAILLGLLFGYFGFVAGNG